jgi:GR25 family glycosyltransferase involved in LPS biosynthesis
MKFSPIALFVYNRPWHTQQTIEALQQNALADQSVLYIYSDAAKNSSSKKQVEEVRELISKVSGFKKVRVIKQTINQGLANSIINGVTEIVNRHGKVIVLEDDIVTSKYFLQFMNESLRLYQNKNSVHSISGCNYPVELKEIKENIYFLRIPLCWGWATWKDRWDHFDKNLKEVKSTPKDIVKYMNFDNTHDYFSQAIKNYKCELNTWFIFWYLLSAKNKTLTLFPKTTLVNNIGHDGSGENCGNSRVFNQNVTGKKITVKVVDIEENEYAVKQHKLFFVSLKPSLFRKILSKLKKSIKNYVYKK